MKHVLRSSTNQAWCGRQDATVKPSELWSYWETPAEICPACIGQVMEVRGPDRVEVYIWPDGETRVLKETFCNDAQAAAYALLARAELQRDGKDCQVTKTILSDD